MIIIVGSTEGCFFLNKKAIFIGIHAQTPTSVLTMLTDQIETVFFFLWIFKIQLFRGFCVKVNI